MIIQKVCSSYNLFSATNNSSAWISGWGGKQNASSAFILHLPGVVWISPECISMSFKLSGHLLNKFTQRARMHAHAHMHAHALTHAYTRTHTEQDPQICPAVCLCHMLYNIVVKCSKSKWKFTQHYLIKQVWKQLNSSQFLALLTGPCSAWSNSSFSWKMWILSFSRGPSCTLSFLLKRRCQKWSWVTKGGGFISHC